MGNKWTPEQKALQSAKMKAYWEAKKEAQNLAHKQAQPVPGHVPTAITSSIVQEHAPKSGPTSGLTSIQQIQQEALDEEAQLEAAYKDIIGRKGITGNLARYQMQELLEDSVTVQMAFKSYLRKLQQGNPLIL